MRVLGSGPRNAKIVIVGEAPGREEEIEGKPFVGASGRLLSQFLANAGIDRASCYITNVAKERPSNNDFGAYYEDPRRTTPTMPLQQMWQELVCEVQTIKPNLTILCGGEALRAVTGHKSVDSWRGSILSTQVGKAIATFHPAYILRQYIHHPIVELDLRRCREESLSADIVLPKMSFTINPSLDQAVSELERMRGSAKVATDIETTRKGLTRCIGFSDKVGTAMVIPLCSKPRTAQGNSTFISFDPLIQSSGSLNSHWTHEEEMVILGKVRDLLEDDNVGKIGQNIPFDATNLAIEFGINIHPIVSDTMLGFHTCYSELPKGLDFLTSIYTRIPYYSDYDPSSDESTWVYCAHDCAATLEVDEGIHKDLTSLGLEEFYRSSVMTALTTYTRAQNRGVLINQEERDRQAILIQAEITRLTLSIKGIVNDPAFNPSSPKQVAEYLYGRCGITPVLHHKTRRPTTDKNAMEALAKKYPNNPIFPLLQDHSSKETILSGFYKIPLGKDSRIYTSFNVAGTVTGRLSSSSSIIFAASTNLQNQKRPDPLPDGTYEVDSQARRCYIADPGWSIIKADYAQAEFWAVVWYARIERLIKRYIDDPEMDVHRWVASLINKISEELVTKPQRTTAKNGVYGGNYKMYYVTAARTYKIPLQLARWVLDEYRKVIPEIPLWWGDVEHQVNTTRRVINPMGRCRYFFDRLEDNLYREAYAQLPQGLVGDMITQSANVMDNTFDEKECHILIQVHDELVLQAKDNVAEEYARRVKKIMEFPVAFPGVETPLMLRADVGVGKNWMETKGLSY